MQIDGLAATSYGALGGGGLAHLFWRDPQVGLFGLIGGLAGAQGATIGWYGAEGEVYAPRFTIGANAGYQDAGASSLLANGGFFNARLTVYPVPDIGLTIGGGQFAGRALGKGRIEYQPELAGRQNVAFFVDGAAGDGAFYRVTGGIRLYIGPAKPLIRRHREDDPTSILVDNLKNPGRPNGGFQ